MTDEFPEGLVAPSATRFPVDGIIDQVRSALVTHGAVVVIAPPGTGKTTRLPLLLAAVGGSDRLIVTEPRRVATRAAAVRMASTLGERVGQTVGYRMRDDTKFGPNTRIEVVTEGVFVRMLQNDPSLEGVSTLFFDEIHERSLDIDLSLTLALDARAVLRPDLKIVVMSATLEGERLAALLQAPLVRTQAVAYPLTITENPTLMAEVAKGVVDALQEQMARAHTNSDAVGDILVFLPGAPEIRRVEIELRRRPLGANVVVYPLTGSLSPDAAALALNPTPDGVRKVVLATAVAQTSITIPGVRTVIDSGLARRSAYDPSTGTTRLVTERVSKATAIQRAGRAGREAPGSVVRLWSAAEFDRSASNDVAEMADSDLTDLALQVALWGVCDPASLTWIDPPPPQHWAVAQTLLRRLRAIDERGNVTKVGKALGSLPVTTRVGAMLLRAAETGDADTIKRACALAAGWSGGSSTAKRLEAMLRVHMDDSQSQSVARQTAAPSDVSPIGFIDSGLTNGGLTDIGLTDGQLAMVAFPERIAVRSGDDPGRYQLVSGGIASLGDDDPLRGTTVLVAVDLDGDRRGGRIFEAVATTIDEALALGQPTQLRRRSTRLPSGRMETLEQTWMGSAMLLQRVVESTADDVASAALADLDLAAALAGGAVGALRARVALLVGLGGSVGPARLVGLGGSVGLRSLDGRDGPSVFSGLDGVAHDWPDWSISALINSADDWLVPALRGRNAKDPLNGLDLAGILRDTLPYELRRRLDTEMPVHISIPTGRDVKIDYLDDGGPTIEAKLQEFFGTRQGPTIAGGRIPVRLVLLSPKGRPAAITANLGAFWTTGYPAVRTDLRGRYPRHPWPEDPTAAVATARAKPRGT
jgi:ATP-dependent helicase HrpB